MRILASPRTDMNILCLAQSHRVIMHQLARALWKVLLSLGTRLTRLSEVLGAAMIALKRAEVQRPIPWTSTERGKEGRVDSKHVEDLSQHRTCT